MKKDGWVVKWFPLFQKRDGVRYFHFEVFKIEYSGKIFYSWTNIIILNCSFQRLKEVR